MLNRFLLYFFGVVFGLLLVDLMFPGKLRNHVDYFSVNKRVINQIINSEINESNVLLLYNISLDSLKKILLVSKVSFKESDIDAKRACNFYKLYNNSNKINVKLCVREDRDYVSEFYIQEN